MQSSKIRVKINKLAALKRAATILAKNQIETPSNLYGTIAQQNTTIITLCIDEIKQPTNPDDFVSAICKMTRSGQYSTLRHIAEQKINAGKQI